MNNDELREALADLAHEQWSGWMRYLFEITRQNADGSVTIYPTQVERWKRQIDTCYCKLSPAEQDSDRKEADRVIALLREKQVLP